MLILKFSKTRDMNKNYNLIFSATMKLKNTYKSLFFIIFGIILISCSNEEEVPSDSPFVYLQDRFGGTSATMDSEARFTATYTVYLSSKVRTNNLTVDYKISTGDGLTEGLDYTLSDSEDLSLVFEPGVYEQSLSINWLPNKLDYSKDNTLTIELISVSDPDVTIGRVGPNKLGSKYVIKKD